MTTTVPTHGGPAHPVRVVTDGKATGRVAIRAYGFTSEADAIAAGYRCEGGPAMSVIQVTQAQLNSGQYVLDGDPKAMPLYTAPAGAKVEGGYSQPVFVVGGGLQVSGASGLLSYSDADSVVITPTLGSNILTDDPGLEIWASATNLTHYGETKAGSSSIDREDTLFHGGAHAAKLTVDGSNSSVSIGPNVASLDIHSWYLFSAWARADSGAPSFVVGPIAAAAPGQFSATLTTDYTQYSAVRRSVTNQYYTIGRAGTSSNLSFYIDDLIIQKLALVSCLQCPGKAASENMAVAVEVTLASTAKLYQAGVAIGLDDPANPANGVFAYHDGTQVFLDKLVAGVWTNLIASTVAYSAGAKVEIRKDGTNYALYYGGTQRGSTQTISDTTVISNKYFGRFATSGGATLANLTMSRYPF